MSESSRGGSAAGAPLGRAPGALGAAGLHLEGARMLRRERRLHRLAAAPVALAIVCFAAALALLVVFAGDLHGLVTGWMPEPSASVWFEWLWVGPARLLLALLGVALFLAVAAVGFASAFLLAGALAAPFLDALSSRIEEIATGAEPAGEGGAGGVAREAIRAIAEELRRVAYFLGIQALIVAGGIAIPGGQLVAPLAMMLVSVLFLPLEYAGYALDRRRLSFRARRRWVFGNAGPMLGFGGLAFVVCLVPGLNFLALPVFVIAGTLLVLRLPPEPG